MKDDIDVIILIHSRNAPSCLYMTAIFQHFIFRQEKPFFNNYFFMPWKRIHLIISP